MDFTFKTVGEIKFGNGRSAEIATLLPDSAKRIFVLTGSTPKRSQHVWQRLKNEGFAVEIFPIAREPDVELIIQAIEAAREFKAESVVAIGGGSVIDSGKAVASLLANPGNLFDYLETVGQGKPITKPSLLMIAVPTTAGTGSEVTRNSVIGVPSHGVKVSMRSPRMLPHFAIVDPELSHDLDPKIAAYSGMDALIQCIEAFISNQANPLADGLASQGIRLAANALLKACGPTLDRKAKEDMCAASVCGGLALANAKLGAVHGFAGPLGGMISAPHGAICASLIIPAWEANYAALLARDPKGKHIAKMDAVARILTSNPEASGNYATAWLEKLIDNLPLSRLGELNFENHQIAEAVRKSSNASSMKGNPIKLSEHQLRDILEAAI